MSIKMPSIQVYTTKHLYHRTTEWLRDLKAKNPAMQTALDAPAGGGALTQFLSEDLGLKTQAIEIDRAKWAYPPVEPILADLGRKLPLQENSLDLVVCLEGLKHFTDVSTAITEFTRILKPGGFLLITIPNDLGLQSRFRYLFDGWVDIDWIHPMDPNSQNERDHFNISSLVSLPYLYYFFEKNKLKLIKTGADRYRFWSVLLGVLFYPILWFVNSRRLPSNHPLRSEMVSFTWLAGRRNLILCQKPL